MPTLKRTGKKITFLSVNIGQPFFAHERIWIRVSYEAAAEFGGSCEHKSVCNFTLDEIDREVEEVVYQ